MGKFSLLGEMGGRMRSQLTCSRTLNFEFRRCVWGLGEFETGMSGCFLGCHEVLSLPASHAISTMHNQPISRHTNAQILHGWLEMQFPQRQIEPLDWLRCLPEG